MSGRKRYERAISSLAERKENKPQIFSGILGVTTNGENQIDVPGRNGFVWVRLRNQLNELIQAFNDTVSTVFDLPVDVEWDKLSPTRYRVIGRDTGRYLDWGSSSSYMPVHGAQHSFNPAIGQTGGDIVWVYSQQFMPLLITPSGSSGAMSVSAQPASYYYNDEFHWAGGTGIAGFDGMRPTGSANARMLLVYLDPDSGNILIATGSMSEFANTITGTAQILPFMPSLIDNTDVPLAGVRLLTGTSSLLWPNLYDLRDYFVHSSSTGTGGAPLDAEYVVMSADPNLTDERILTGTVNQISIADGGAGGNVTLSTPQDIHTAATPTFGGATLDGNSTTALLVEQNGVNDNVLIVDTANGRVGINKAPSSPIDVEGSAIGASVVFDLTNTAASSTLGAFQILAPNLQTGGSIFYFAFGTAASARNRVFFGMRNFGSGNTNNLCTMGFFAVDDILVFVANRRVMINGRTPAATFHVKNEAAATTVQIVQGAASQSANLQEYQDSNGDIFSHVLAGGEQIQYKQTVTKTGAYTATVDDEVILCDANGGAFTITLPAASGNAGLNFHIKKIDDSVNAVTIDGNASETIDGDLSFDIEAQYESIHIVCDGSNWHVL